eukprot:6508099-Pyramimonas_sp.AAC.1
MKDRFALINDLQQGLSLPVASPAPLEKLLRDGVFRSLERSASDALGAPCRLCLDAMATAT